VSVFTVNEIQVFLSDTDMISRKFLLRLLAAAAAVCMVPVSLAQECADEGKPAIDPSCPDRDHLMRCAAVHLDGNDNGKLDREELQGAIDGLNWLARGVLQILGSVDKMMQKCDVDGDGAISIDYDMQNNKETCLATCFKKRAFKNAFFPDCDL